MLRSRSVLIEVIAEAPEPITAVVVVVVVAVVFDREEQDLEEEGAGI